MRITNLTDKTIGQLTVLEKTENKNPKGYFIYKCKCSCGTELEKSSQILMQAVRKNCNTACNDCRSKNQKEVAKRVNELRKAKKLEQLVS